MSPILWLKMIENDWQEKNEKGITCIISNGGWKLSESSSKGFHGQSLFSMRSWDLHVNLVCHVHLSGASPWNGSRLLHCLGNNTKGIMEGSVSFVKQVGASPSQDDGTGMATLLFNNQF